VTTVCGKLSFFKEQIFFFQKSTFAVGHNDWFKTYCVLSVKC
jgi:hypothetical protein